VNQLPVLLQIFVIFGLIVLASARKLHLGLAAGVGGVLFALWRGMPVSLVAQAAFGELLSADTLLLLALMSFIMAFSAAMKKAGAMDAFSRALSAVAPSPRVAMAAAPLLIGTLPMPGGAILSAPLVDAMDPGRIHTSDVLSAANYWFRHNLELAWPLYPAFILTASLSGLSVGRLMLLNAYAAPALFALGLLFILPATRLAAPAPRGETVGERGVDAAGSTAIGAAAAGGSSRGGEARAPEGFFARAAGFARGVAPLAIVLGGYLALDILWKLISPGFGLSPGLSALFGRYLPIFLGLAAGSLYLRFSVAGAGCFKGSLGASTFKLIMVILGIRVFSTLLSAAGVAADAAAELAAAGIPALAAVALLPFVAGLVTGVGFGYVGLAFPIILGLLPEGGAFPREAGIVLAGAFGYAGMMLSPLHVCMVVSAEHFGTGLAATIRRFALPLSLFVAVGTAYASLLAWLL
jgi:uncharacterized protein